MSEELGKICPVCRKHFWVMYPHLWAYKRGYGLNQQIYFCSWKCLRTDEKKEKINVRRLTDEQRKEAVRIHLEGGDAKKYLEEIGCAGPEAVWYSIRKKLKETDPETWAKVQATIPKSPFQKKAEKPKTAGDAMAACAATADKFFQDCKDMGLLKNTGKERVPLQYAGYTVCCIESKTFGRFYWDRDRNYLDWTTAEGEEIGFTPTGWKMFLEELPKVAAILGVSLE